MKVLGIGLTLFSIVLVAFSLGSAEKHKQWRPDVVTNIQYQPYIVRGVIEGVREAPVTQQITGETFAPVDVTYRFLVFTLRVEEMLKGRYADPTMDVLFLTGVVGRPVPRPSAGDEVIVCADIKAPLWKLLPGYLVHPNGWLFYDGPERWKSLGTGQTLRLDDIRQIIDESSMPATVQKADFVVEGQIVKVEASELEPPEEYVRSGSIIGVAEVQTITMRVESVHKGTVKPGETVTFQMVRRGGYSPWWRREVPRCMEVGQRWLVALQQDPDVGYFPFAGSNGLLRIEANGEMSYEGLSRFPSRYGLSKTQVGAVIHDALQ